MKTISQTLTGTRLKTRRLPADWPRLPAGKITLRDVERLLQSYGGKPVDPATKRRLIASGNWGMPKE